MPKIITLMIIFTVCLFSIMIASIRYMNFLMEKMVGKKHRWIEFLLHTSIPPETWAKPYKKKIARHEGNIAKVSKIEKRAKASYIRKINKLISYMKVSTLVDGEDTRAQIIKSLMDIKAEWEMEEYNVDGNEIERKGKSLDRGYSF